MSPVVKGYFDAYLHCVVAPDHLLTGTGKCLVEVFFLQLDDKAKQQQLNKALAESMKVLGAASH